MTSLLKSIVMRRPSRRLVAAGYQQAVRHVSKDVNEITLMGTVVSTSINQREIRTDEGNKIINQINLKLRTTRPQFADGRGRPNAEVHNVQLPNRFLEMAETIQKGDRLMVMGRLAYRNTYTDYDMAMPVSVPFIFGNNVVIEKPEVDAIPEESDVQEQSW